jgi:protein gp37
MGERTDISWTDHSWSPWVGCTKVSAACDHCYAESWAKRTGHPELWKGERRRTSSTYWQQPFKWNNSATSAERPRVFPSLCDPFDNQVPARWRDDFWHRVHQTPRLDWLLLTKRPQNIPKMLPDPRTGVPGWGDGWPNVWLGLTAENQEEFDRRWAHLAAVPARVRFISYEPALGPLRMWSSPDVPLLRPFPHWIICGGESGGGHRPMDLNWVRDIRDDCAHLGIAFHFKQHGGARPTSGGCLLDGREHKAFPESSHAL